MKYLLHCLLFIPWLLLAQNAEDQSERYERIRENLYRLRDNLQSEVEVRNPSHPAFKSPNDDLAFSEVYKKVFSTVVLGKTDAIANGSAFSYAQDNNKSTFSLNGTWVLGDNLLFDGGLNLKSKDNSYAYYKDERWSNDITIKAGLAYKMKYFQKTFYNKEDATLANKARSEFFESKYKAYSDLVEKGLQVNTDNEQLEALETKLNNVPALAQEIKDAYAKSDHAAKPYHGYRILWANLSGSYTNAAFSIANDSVVDSNIQEKFNSISKFTIEGSLNFHQKGITHFYIAQLYGRFNRVSILDNVNLIDKKIKASPVAQQGQYSLYYYESDDATVHHFGTYSQIHAPVLMVDYGFYFAYLYPLKQQLGINARVNFSTPYGDNEYNFSRSYSVLVGPIFRINKDKLFSAATFTITCGFENTLYNERASDKFTIKASAALPFNVFEKSK